MKHQLLYLLIGFLPWLAPADTPLRVLFLGDRGHHKPADRYAWVKDRFAAEGVELTYTDKMEDLDPSILTRYDVLALYANIESISPAQEAALLSFIKQGGGFAPIHCASACFGHSKPLIELIGARFKSHGAGVFSPIIINHTHPLMRGFTGYETWDETYIHADHNEKDRTVLAVRAENGVREPWTWVRDQGNGRVFYTASGHDARTWRDPRFQELLLRGIAWSAGPRGASLLAKWSEPDQTQRDRPPLRYEPRPTVQNYEKRDPYPQYQYPLDPQGSMAYARTEKGFELHLFASEPDVIKPMAMTWDHRGRLWVIESPDYPNRFTEQGKGGDRIKICEDTDGDGRADRFTVFADGLNIPTGLMFARGGLVVAQAPYLLLLRDTNGDDRADERTVLLDGWSKSDTHAGPSNLKWGFDNAIWGSVGYAGFKGEVGGRTIEFRQCPFRFERDGSQIEQVGQFNNNTWGFAFNEAGEYFGSTANNAHHFYIPIPTRYFRAVVGMERDDLAQKSIKIDAHFAAHPLTDRIRQVDVFGGYTAAAGHNLYTARLFPERYWNRAAFVCEPTMHLVHQGFLRREGSGWVEDGDGLNLVASEDEWFAPVHAETGPDGAVWVADWYNFIIQHNPTPKKEHGGFDAVNGPGNAHENPLRDTTHGRIYRIVPVGNPATARLELQPGNPPQLIEALRNQNLFWRLTAQRMLVERGDSDVVPALIALTQDTRVDSTGLNGGALHALWTLHGLGQLDGRAAAPFEAAVAALRHPSAAVRRNAAQVLPRTEAGVIALRESGLLADPDLNVRLAACLAAADMPADDGTGRRIESLARSPDAAADRDLMRAATLAGARHAAGYLLARLEQTNHEASVIRTEARSILEDSGFEKEETARAPKWAPQNWSGEATFTHIEGGRVGRGLEIQSTTGADVSWTRVVPCKPGTRYELTGWIKCRDLKGARGAQFNIHNIASARSEAITGTSDWTFIRMPFESGTETELIINCLFGGWGRSTGTAWWDDVMLIERGSSSANPGLDRDRIIAWNLGARAPIDQQLDVLARLGAVDAQTAGAVLDGLSAAWQDRLAPYGLGESERAVLRTLAGKLDANNQRRLGQLARAWDLHRGLPGLAGEEPTPRPVKTAGRARSEAERQRIEKGKAQYLALCVACHQPDGKGLPAVAPPLAGSEWVSGSEGRLIRMVLHGVQGPIEAAGVHFNLVMPPWKDALDDNGVADVLTYIRSAWGHDAKAVSAGTVKAIRADESARKEPWTVPELMKIP